MPWRFRVRARVRTNLRSLLEWERKTPFLGFNERGMRLHSGDLTQGVDDGLANLCSALLGVKRLESTEYPRDVVCRTNLNGKQPAFVIGLTQGVFDFTADVFRAHGIRRYKNDHRSGLLQRFPDAQPDIVARQDLIAGAPNRKSTPSQLRGERLCKDLVGWRVAYENLHGWHLHNLV